LLFGDGQARGLGVWFAFNLLSQHIESPDFQPTPGAERVFRSLLAVPVVLPPSLVGLGHGLQLVECAIMQNIKAQMQQPLNTLEWCFLILQQSNESLDELLGWGSPNLRRDTGKALVIQLTKFLSDYHNHSEVQAYDLEAPAAKRPRRKRVATNGSVAAKEAFPEDSKEDTVKVGWRRLKAMKNILTKISWDGYQRWQDHLNWVGLWKYSAMQDAVAAEDAMWPDSQLPQSMRPSEMEIMASEVGSKVADLHVPHGASLARAEVFYHERMTPEQHEMVLHKGFEIYEAETLHLTNLNEKISLRPSYETWLTYRTVIEHWDRTIKQVALKDMAPSEFKELELAILNSSCMDQQILDALRGYPKYFHLAMLPDLKGAFEEEMEIEQQAIEKAQVSAWQTNWEHFKLLLLKDHQLIRKTKLGSEALKDILEWLELKSKISMQQDAKGLSAEYVQHLFPPIAADTWDTLPGKFAVASSTPIPLKGGVFKRANGGRNLLIMLLNFNVPNSRDAMKMGMLAACLATIAQQVGPENAIVAIALGARAKEESTQDVLDLYIICKSSWKPPKKKS